MPYSVKKQGDLYRVTLDGKTQPSVDNGGFRNRQSALDAAIKANKGRKTMGEGMADKARSGLQNRRNRIAKAVSGAQ